MKVADLQAATKAVAESYRKKWEAERASLDKMIAAHETLPNNYWVNEHRARALYLSALSLEELLSCELSS